MIRSLRTAALAALAVFLVACGSEPPPADDQDGASGGSVSGEVVVFAAASLTETFGELGRRFEEAHPGTMVTFNFAGSSSLAKQIVEGAPVDVFASASPTNMDQVTDIGALSGESTVFVRNRLEIAVPAGNPGDVTGLADFGDDDQAIGLCAEQVPCGAAAKKALDAAGVTAAPDTLERDVKAVLTKVELGEVDAALVYRTDVRAASDTVEGIEFAESEQAVNDYPIATLAEAPNADGAQAFVDFVLSDAGLSVLTADGFDSP
jgi:molybdate transport system substrate-binding protein